MKSKRDFSADLGWAISGEEYRAAVIAAQSKRQRILQAGTSNESVVRSRNYLNELIREALIENACADESLKRCCKISKAIKKAAPLQSDPSTRSVYPPTDSLSICSYSIDYVISGTGVHYEITRIDP